MNIAYGPKVKPLTSKESLSSLEAWRSNVTYGLRLNPSFREFLSDAMIFGKKTRTNPTRDLEDVYKKERMEQEDKTFAEVLVKSKTKEERCDEVDLLLEQVANYCPHVPRTDITRDCGSMKEVWSTIRRFYNKQRTGASLNEVWNVRKELDESPQCLYARMKQLYLDNLLTTDGVRHTEGRVREDEELSPTLLNIIILHWLQVLNPNLRDLVTQRFITQLRDQTYAAILPEIFTSVDALLEELNNPIPVHRVSYPASSKSYPNSKSYPSKPFYKPNNSFNNFKSSGQFKPKSGKMCMFCKLTGKKMFHTHTIEDCFFIQKLNSQSSAVHQVTQEVSDWELQCQEFYECEGESPPEYEAEHTVEHVINSVSGDASPVLELIANNQTCFVTLDTGAPCNLIKESKALEINAPIRSTTQRVRMADGATYLNVVGETDITLYRDNKPYRLPAIVCRDTDTEILAGIPFMKTNDVAIRPYSDEIILGGTSFVKYNPNGSCSRTVKKLTLTTNINKVLLPGQSITLSTPNLSGEVAIEPRWDSSHNKHSKESSFWPSAQVAEISNGEITLQNHLAQPITIRKHEPVCNLKVANNSVREYSKTINSVKPMMKPTPESCKNKTSSYSGAVKLNPDGIMSKENEERFHKLLSTYDEVFGPVKSTYNGNSGPCHVQVNIGPNLPPQRKGRVPFYGDDGLKELQEYCDDLQARGILSKPEDVGITVENINPSFLVNKPPPSIDKRLVTDFKSIKDYCRPTPSLLPNVETIIRRISSHRCLLKTDMSQAYWQIEMKKESKRFCGIHTPYKGVLVYNVGSMGLPGVESALEELTCLVLGE